MAVGTLMDEMTWMVYGSQELHTPLIRVQQDADDQEMLLDMLGTLTRMLDTRINYVTNEGKIIREWVETILKIGARYRRELEILESLESRSRLDA
jgi:hypothetical protein